MQSTHIVIREKVKEHTTDMSLAKDFCEALDQKVLELITQAKKRAKANQRNTLMPRDL